MRSTKLVAFAGPAGSGKDTAAAILMEHGFIKLAFAGPLKAMLAAIGLPDPITQDKKEEIIPWLGVSYRHAAQTLGTEWGRKLINPNVWVIMALRAMDPAHSYVFTDMRFENEADAVREKNGIIIHMTGRSHAMTGATKLHASESGIAMKQGDFMLDNSGSLIDLRNQLRELFQEIVA